MVFPKFFFNVAVLLISVVVVVDLWDCPNLFDTPQGELQETGQLTGMEKCFLDCTRDQEYDMACEDVDFVTLLSNAKKVPLVDKALNAFIFNSPKLTELDGGTFGPMKSHMKELSLMGLSHLTSFPMLKDLQTLQVLKIQNTPQLKQFSPEILPANLTKLILLSTAIQQLSVDLQETKKMFRMTDFIFINQTVQSLRKDFLSIFPNLETAIFSNNTFNIDSVSSRPLAPGAPYLKFVLSNNNFAGTPFTIRMQFIEALLDSMRIADNGVLDLSYNGLSISKKAVASFSKINTVAELFLAGNQFGGFFKAAGLFASFSNLKRLDLASSNVPRQKGVFSELSQLEHLNLRGNKFRDLNRIDIFDGCRATLLRLDLSDNMLTTLPSGTFLELTHSLRELNLAGNFFHTELLDEDNLDAMPSPLPAKYNLTNLQILDLSRTHLMTFKGSWVANLTRLTQLDVSCNKFTQISKSFFEGMPGSIQKLNMSFCVTTLPDVPDIDKDAFSTLGSDNTSDVHLNQLILSSSYLKGWIFFRLAALPKRTLANLTSLDLSHNQIRFLEQRHLQPFTDLQALNLAGNYMQTIGKATFTGMTSLRSLDLSHNRVVSIQRDELVNCIALTRLDLSSNNIVNIDQAAFDDLPLLRELYLNRNPKIQSMNSMFMNGGKSLVHLGIMHTGLSLVTYPEGCINRTDLDPLTSLKYFYIDNSTAVYVDHGNDFDSWKNRINNSEMLPDDPGAMQCVFGNRVTNPPDAPDREPGGSALWTNDFVRLVIRNPFDLSPRTFMAHIPKCYGLDFKWVANSTSAFICPNLDSKTFIPSATTPAPES